MHKSTFFPHYAGFHSLYLSYDYFATLLGMMQIYRKPHINEFVFKLQIPNFERRHKLFLLERFNTLNVQAGTTVFFKVIGWFSRGTESPNGLTSGAWGNSSPRHKLTIHEINFPQLIQTKD